MVVLLSEGHQDGLLFLVLNQERWEDREAILRTVPKSALVGAQQILPLLTA